MFTFFTILYLFRFWIFDLSFLSDLSNYYITYSNGLIVSILIMTNSNHFIFYYL